MSFPPESRVIETTQPGDYISCVTAILEAENSREVFATLQAENPEKIADCLGHLEAELGVTGAEFALFIHTRKQKKDFDAALERYSGFMGLVLEQRLHELTSNNVSESQLVQGAAQTLTASKRAVLTADIEYRLDHWVERAKGRVADDKISRTVGKLGTAAASGGIFYLVAKGLVNSSSPGDNIPLILAGAGSQVGLRWFGQELTEITHRQLDEYVLSEAAHEEKEDPAKNNQFKRHEAHLSIVEGELHKVANTHLAQNEGSTEGLAQQLTDVLDVWYREYYRQPTWKDRLTLIAVGSGTAACLGATALHI